VILPDPKYADRVVAKLINIIMLDGKKSTAERALYGALEIAAAKASDEPVKVLKKCLDNIKPMLEVKSRRVGGSTYQVPVEVRPEPGVAGHALAGEVLQRQKREDCHRQARRRNPRRLQ